MTAGDWKDMFLAAEAGDTELVRHHLAGGVDPNFSHAEFQSTALVAAILAGHEARRASREGSVGHHRFSGPPGTARAWRRAS